VGGLAGELAMQVEKAATASDTPVAQPDGRLCGLAETLLALKTDAPPREVALTQLANQFGLGAGPNQSLLATLETEDVRQMATRLTEGVQKYAAKVGAARYGIASDRLGKNSTRVVLLLQGPGAAVEGLPRRLELGQKAELRGTLEGELEAPKVLVSDAQGLLTTVDQPPGKAFKAQVACGAKPGSIVVEVRAEEMGNERSVVSLPVACGRPLEVGAQLTEPAWPAGAEGQEKRMAELIDAERAAAGLSRLTWLEPLGAIARASSEAYRDGAKKGATVVPVNVMQRLVDADIQAPVVLQNPAAAFSAGAAMDRLMASPSHRGSILSAEVNAGGLGITSGADAQGRQLVYVNQLFVKIPPPPDVPVMRQAILEIVARKRAEEKLPAMAVDPELDRIAGEYATLIAEAGGPPPRAKSEAFEKALQKGYRDIILLRDARLDPNDYAEDPNVLSKGKLYGMGAALGRHPRLGKNTLFVVLIIANPLKAPPPAKAPAKKKAPRRGPGLERPRSRSRSWSTGRSDRRTAPRPGGCARPAPAAILAAQAGA
jgi:uncharacterized protein YkwD